MASPPPVASRAGAEVCVLGQGASGRIPFRNPTAVEEEEPMESSKGKGGGKVFIHYRMDRLDCDCDWVWIG